MFLPVNESSCATLHLFSSKNKQCFAYYLYLAYKWGSGTNFLFKAYFQPHHLPLLTPQHPLFLSPSKVFLRPSAPITTSKSKFETGWLDGRTSARHPGPEKKNHNALAGVASTDRFKIYNVRDLKTVNEDKERATGNCGVTLRRDQQGHVRDFVMFLDGPSIHITATQQLQCVAVLKPDQWLCRVPWCGVKVAKSPRAIFRTL